MDWPRLLTLPLVIFASTIFECAREKKASNAAFAIFVAFFYYRAIKYIFRHGTRYATRYRKKKMNQPPRFPGPTPDELTEEQKRMFAEADRVVLESFGPTFRLRDAEGHLLGPFGILSYTPNSFIPYLQHVHAAVGTKFFSPRERELATLAVCFVTQAQYVLYAHKHVALSIGFNEKQVEDALTGKIPKGLNERETIIYELALEMAKCHGRLGDRQWETGRVMFGREGVSSLAQVVGCYMHSCVIINCAEVRIPEEKL